MRCVVHVFLCCVCGGVHVLVYVPPARSATGSGLLAAAFCKLVLNCSTSIRDTAELCIACSALCVVCSVLCIVLCVICSV